MPTDNLTREMIEPYVQTCAVGARLIDLPVDTLKHSWLTKITRVAFIACIIQESESRFQSTALPWKQVNDEALLTALDLLKQLAPQLHHTTAPSLLEGRAKNLGERVRKEFSPWIDPSEEHPANYPAKSNEDTFTRMWVETLHRFRISIVRLMDEEKKARLARDNELQRGAQISAQQLLSFWENGTEHCPALAQLLRERPDLPVFPDPHDGSRLFFHQFRWHAVRWVIVLAQMADNMASVERWSKVLNMGKRDHPEHASGIGATTLLHVFHRYGFDAKTILATPGEEDWRVSMELPEE